MPAHAEDRCRSKEPSTAEVLAIADLAGSAALLSGPSQGISPAHRSCTRLDRRDRGRTYPRSASPAARRAPSVAWTCSRSPSSPARTSAPTSTRPAAASIMPGSVSSGAEDYYLAGPEAGGRWTGSTAGLLGLDGRVSEGSLRAVLSQQVRGPARNLAGPAARARVAWIRPHVLVSVPESASVLYPLCSLPTRRAAASGGRWMAGSSTHTRRPPGTSTRRCFGGSSPSSSRPPTRSTCRRGWSRTTARRSSPARTR